MSLFIVIDSGNYLLVSLTSVPSKTLEQIPLEDMLKHMEDREGIRQSTWLHQGQIMPD